MIASLNAYYQSKCLHPTKQFLNDFFLLLYSTSYIRLLLQTIFWEVDMEEEVMIYIVKNLSKKTIVMCFIQGMPIDLCSNV